MLPFFNQNPQAVAIKRYLFELIKERYDRNKGYIERLSVSTLTREDYDALGRLLADVYESGFVRAVEQYKDQMSKLGLKVNIVAEKSTPAGPSIFKED
jgi:hypothetical protein